MPVLLLFDIDGTILKLKDGISRKILSDILKDLFHIDFDVTKIKSFAGKTDLQILREISETFCLDFEHIKKNISFIWEEMLKYFDIHCTPQNIEVMPGIPELLQSLSTHSHFNLGLLTGNFEANAYLKLRKAGLARYFNFGAFGSDTEDRKMLPPMAISRGNDYNGEKIFDSSNTIIIGDSPGDIECAKSNGCLSISVATGVNTFDELNNYYPDLLVHNFLDIDIIFSYINRQFKNIFILN